MKNGAGIFLIFIFFIFFCGCQKKLNDKINFEYNIILPFLIDRDDIIKQSDNYIILRLTQINKQKLIDLFKNNKNYTTWQELTGAGIFIDGLSISGEYVFCAAKNISHTQIKKVFIHKKKEEVIFVNINWSGY